MKENRIRPDAFNEIALLLERAELALDRMGESSISTQLYSVIIAVDQKRMAELPAPSISHEPSESEQGLIPIPDGYAEQ